MSNRREQIGRLARMLCAFVLVLSGFGLKPPHVPRTVPAGEFATFVLPDGSVPFLCDKANLTRDGDTVPMHSHARCEACVLSGPALLPPAPALGCPPTSVAARLPAPVSARPQGMAFRLTAAPRGPPAAFA